MEKEGQLYFLSKYALVLLVIVSSVMGCATSARELPNDYTSVDARTRLHLDDFDVRTVNLSCSEISDELKILEEENEFHAQVISGNRTHNQVASYIGSVFFLPAYLATDNDLEAKEKIENINKAKDELYKLRVFKGCR